MSGSNTSRRSTLELNGSQLAAVAKLGVFVQQGIPGSVACLRGYAGTGKTTVLSRLEFPWKTRHYAPTHKACQVAERGLGQPVETVASLLATRAEMTNKGEVRFVTQRTKQISSNNAADPEVLIIDEASMCSHAQVLGILDYAWRSNCVVLFVGDPAQLPPPQEEESYAFSPKVVQCTVTLREVMRQASGNPLTEILTRLRENSALPEAAMMGDYGLAVRTDPAVWLDEAAEQFKKHRNTTAAKVLTYRNEIVTQLNKALRKRVMSGITEGIALGDILTAYGGAKALRNGLDYIVVSRRPVRHGNVLHWECVLSDGFQHETVEIVDPSEVNMNRKRDALERRFQELRKSSRQSADAFAALAKETKNSVSFEDIRSPSGLLLPKGVDYGYACTVHKSQGSTYDRVYVNDTDIIRAAERRALLYVAYSRAREQVCAFRGGI